MTIDRGVRLYTRLLGFYPEDLRRDHGVEMAQVFADDLAAARREDGVRGAFRVWRSTAFEFLRLALPSWFAAPAVRVPAITIGLFAAMLLSMLPGGLLQPGEPGPFPWLRCALLLPLFSPPLICLAVFCADRASGVKEHPPCSKPAL